jgi:Zn finger protein HypA/HybF involved in hydrogenase expression
MWRRAPVHEHAVLRELMRQLDDLARAHDAPRVLALRVWLGASCHLSESHFREHFTVLARGSVAEDAALTVETSDDPRHPDAQSLRIVSIEVPA